MMIAFALCALSCIFICSIISHFKVYVLATTMRSEFNNMLELDTFMYTQEIDYAAGFKCACHNCSPSSPGFLTRLVYDNGCTYHIHFF